MNEFYNSIPSNCTEYTRRRPLAHTSHPASHVLRPRKLVPRLTSKATTTTADGGGDGTTGGGAGSSTLNTMMSAACKIQYVSGGGQHSAAIVKTGSMGFAL
jgi:hypothetical protein